ncbi:MAG: ribonuclease H-like domain-containing protein [Armatimonadota bacterium]
MVIFMPSILDKLSIATGGHAIVQDNWIPATALRPLIHGDPCLIWLQHHGAKHGFEKDPDDTYSFLSWIGEKGRQFEDAWVQNVAGPMAAVQALGEDVDVRSAAGLRRTLEIMDSGASVITKAGLWWAPECIYGSADVLCRASWFYKKFPHLRPKGDDNETDHWIVIDAKFQTELQSDKSKQHDYEAAATQVRLYSYIVGQLTGITPPKAYLATRDCPLTLVEVEVPPPSPEGRLPADIADLRDECLAIKLDGSDWLPWLDHRTAPNFSSHKNAPWSKAVKKISREFYDGGPLETLPGIGRKQAEALQAMGYSCVADILAAPTDAIKWTKIRGIGSSRAARIEATINAALSNTPSRVTTEQLPKKVDVELFLDFEYLSNVNVDYDRDWPTLQGREMVFMVGIGWKEDSAFMYKQFVAEREDYEAEKDLFQRLLQFLEERDVFDAGRSAVLYHWSSAEVWQAKRAGERHGLPQLAELPWQDLRQTFSDGQISVPGAYGLGLKEIAKAVGELAPDYKTEWPDDLADGLSAMVMGWVMYARGGAVSNSPEIKLLSKYLEADVQALHAVLGWLRASAVMPRTSMIAALAEDYSPAHWWRSTSEKKVIQRTAVVLSAEGWYHRRMATR